MRKPVLLSLASMLGVFVLAETAPAAARASAELRALVSQGELPAVLAALKKRGVAAKDLLAALRERPAFESGPPGLTQHDLRDGHGRKTDLHMIAPTSEAIRSRSKQGLGLVVLLHGLKGSGKQCVPFAQELVQGGDVVCVAPSAQPIPAGIAPEDGCPDYVTKMFPHWWLYESKKSFIFESIKKARSMYPIDPDRIVICGVSMGGYGTWNNGLRHADRWAAVAPLCGGISRLEQVGMGDERSRTLLVNAKLFPMFAIHGDKDEVVPYGPDKSAADKVKELGGDMRFETLEGAGHNIKDAILGNGELASDLRKFVTTKRRQSQPTEVTYQSLAESLDGAYWLRIAERSKKDARLTGKIDRKANRIFLEGEGVSRARVFVDDRIVDISKPVSVVVNGDVKFQGKVAPDLRGIVESWRTREDEALVYPAFVDVELAR